MNIRSSLTIILAVSLLALSGCTQQNPQQPQDIAGKFVADLHTYNLKSASTLAENSRLLQFGITSKLDEVFLKSLLTTDKFEIISCHISKNEATVQVKVVAPNTDQIFPQLLQAGVDESFTGSSTEQTTFMRELPSLIEKCPKYSRTVPLNMVKEGGRWKVSTSNDSFMSTVLAENAPLSPVANSSSGR